MKRQRESYLGNSVVAEINARVEGEEGSRPRKEGKETPRSKGGGSSAIEEAEEGEIGSKEEHILGVAGWPSVGVANL